MHKVSLYALGLLVAANASVYTTLWSRFAAPELSVHFLAVGQGDAELVQTRQANFLIDAGPSYKTVQELDRIIPASRRVLDVVLLTHPNNDHVAGVFEIAKRYAIRLLVTNAVETTNATEQLLVELARSQHIPVVWARAGQVLRVGQARFTVLWPDGSLVLHASVPERKINDTAIAGVLSQGDARAFFAGDISSAVEHTLASALVSVDVLKVAHHGSKYSTSAEFLRTTHPRIAVVEAGKNSYGLPTADVLARLRAAGALVWRTDTNGTLDLAYENGMFVAQSVR